MPKKKPITRYRIFIYGFSYVLLLCFSVYEYYYGYYLLQSGLVLQDAVIISVLCVILAVFLPWRKVKPVIAKLDVRHWRNYLNGILLAVLFTWLLCLLLVGCIAVVNSNIGPQQHAELNALLVNVNRETGRGGNAQYYYKFYHFDRIGAYKNYMLRSPNKIYFEKKVHLELMKGCLGILYKKE